MKKSHWPKANSVVKLKPHFSSLWKTFLSVAEHNHNNVIICLSFRWPGIQEGTQWGGPNSRFLLEPSPVVVTAGTEGSGSAFSVFMLFQESLCGLVGVSKQLGRLRIVTLSTGQVRTLAYLLSENQMERTHILPQALGIPQHHFFHVCWNSC